MTDIKPKITPRTKRYKMLKNVALSFIWENWDVSEVMSEKMMVIKAMVMM